MITQCSFCDMEIKDLNSTHCHKLDANYLYFHLKCWAKILSFLNLTSTIRCTDAESKPKIEDKTQLQFPFNVV